MTRTLELKKTSLSTFVGLQSNLYIYNRIKNKTKTKTNRKHLSMFHFDFANENRTTQK